MWVRHSLDRQFQRDPEWLRELATFLNDNGNQEKFKAVKTIFYETYLENIRDGMRPKDAIQKAKSVAICFLFEF
jgi:hypothetical protein